MVPKIINLKVQLPREFHTRLAVAAAKRKITLKQFVTEAIEAQLKPTTRASA